MDTVKNELDDNGEEKQHSIPPIFEVNIKEEWRDIEIAKIETEFQEAQGNSDQDINWNFSNFDHNTFTVNVNEKPLTCYPDNSNIKSFNELQYLVKVETPTTGTEKLSDQDICTAQLNSANENYLQPSSNNNTTISGEEISKQTDLHEIHSKAVNLQDLDFEQKKSKKCVCTECHKMFPRMSNLRRHVNSVHKKLKSHQCKECQKTFFQASHLKVHINSVHKGIKRHQCYKCQKMFTQSSHLKTHIDSVHKGIKRHVCNRCCEKFCNKAELQRHVYRVHDGFKSKWCFDCNEMFYDLMSYQEHTERVHNGMNYKCNECQTMFSHIKSLHRHLKVVHKDSF